MTRWVGIGGYMGGGGANGIMGSDGVGGVGLGVLGFGMEDAGETSGRRAGPGDSMIAL